MNYYLAYGLVVKSNFDWPELTALTEYDDRMMIDVEIQYHDVVEEKIKLNQDDTCHYADQHIWFKVHNVALFDMKDGAYISITPYQECVIDEIKQYLYGVCFGIILLQRNQLAIHGGSINFKDNGLVIMGNSGAGKSTLTTALRKKNYALIADDISVINLGETITLSPGFPQQRLCQDAMEFLGYHLNDFQSIEMENVKKYLIPVKDQFTSEPVPLKVIIELKVSKHCKGVEIRQLEGMQRFKSIFKNLFLIDIKQYVGLNPHYFKNCIKIAEDVPVYRITRPKGVDTIKEQIACIESLFELIS